MIRELKIAREGQELGAWPFDIVFALVRCGSLVPTDTFWIDGMEEWKPVSELIPPPPSHNKQATFLGRHDDEMPWVFYSRDGSTVIGPRPADEILFLSWLGALTEDNLVFIANSERWISVADFLRMIDKESPGALDFYHRIQRALAAEENASITSQLNRDSETSDSDWLQTGLNLTALSPHIGGAYLGFHAFKNLSSWFTAPQSQAEQKRLEGQPIDSKNAFFSTADRLWKNREWTQLIELLEGSPYPLSVSWKKRYEEARTRA